MKISNASCVSAGNIKGKQTHKWASRVNCDIDDGIDPINLLLESDLWGRKQKLREALLFSPGG
jgi:hypothetical protein